MGMTCSPAQDAFGYEITHLALTVVYGSFCVICIANMILKWKQNTLHWNNLFYLLLCVGCTTRGVYMISQYLIEESSTIRNIPDLNAIENVLNSIPSFIFFSAYLIILFRWAIIYHNSYEMSFIKFAHVKVLFYFINMFMYTVVFTLYFLDAAVFPGGTEYCGFVTSTVVEQITYGFCAVMYLLTSLGFVLYTVRITRKFRYLPSRNNAKEDVSVRLQRFTILVLIVFCARAILILYTNFWYTDFSLDYWYVDVLYYLLLEIIPLGLMFVILKIHPTKSPPDGPNSTTPLINNSLYA